MKAPSLDERSQESIVARILKLTPDSKPLWGDMKVSEMLFHCSLVNKMVIQGKPPVVAPTLKQRMIKLVVLYMMKHFPKGVKTGPRFLPRATDNIDFYTMQQELVNVVDTVVKHQSPIYGKHPFFGPLKTKEWRRFMWKHLDHHLRQFDV